MIRYCAKMSLIGRPTHDSHMKLSQLGHLAFASAALVLLLLAQACGGKEARPNITVEEVTVGREANCYRPTTFRYSRGTPRNCDGP